MLRNDKLLLIDAIGPFFRHYKKKRINWSKAPFSQLETENGLRQAKYMKEQEAKHQRRESIEKSLDDLARAEEQDLVKEMQQLELLMGAGIEAFQSNRFELAEDYANRVLAVQPDNTKARELALASNRAQHEHTERQFLIDEKLRFREWMDDITATRVLRWRDWARATC